MRITLILALCCLQLSRALGSTETEPYLLALKNLANNTTLDYVVNCKYEDSRSFTVRGHTSMSGNLYYDSSDVRTVLITDDVYVQADHAGHTLSILDLTKFTRDQRSKLKEKRNRYLYDDVSFNKNAVITVMKESSDKIWISVKLKDDQTLNSMTVEFDKATKLPRGYTVSLNIYDAENNRLQMDILVQNIKVVSPKPDIFSSKRFFKLQENRILPLKFSNYKLFTNKTK